MRFRTEIDIADPGFRLGYQDRILALGSCFAEHMTERLLEYRFPACINPFGILYNPASIAGGLERLLDPRPFTRQDLRQHDEHWFSFQHHGRFSSRDPDQALALMQAGLDLGADFLRTARLLILTFGTAFVYALEETGEVVANCHRLPERAFRRRRLSVDEIVARYVELLARIRVLNPSIRVLLTVSPVRHWKDGATQNLLSKSILVLTCHGLIDALPEIGYFPAYELMMDDLRDYRFYQPDMLHPSPVAIDYIWSRFSDACLDPRCAPVMAGLERLRAARGHRARDPGSAAHRRFLERQLEEIEALQAQAPELDLSGERKHFVEALAALEPGDPGM